MGKIESSEVERAYRVFEAVRWPGGCPDACPRCHRAGRFTVLASPAGARRTRTGAVTQRRVWRCAACRTQFSVLTGTVFEGTRVALPQWLQALGQVREGELSARDALRVTGDERETARTMSALVAAGWAAAAAQPQG